RTPGTVPEDGGGPGHVPPHYIFGFCSGLEGRARVLVLRVFTGVRAFRRWNRSVLGARARAGTIVHSAKAPACGRGADAGTRRHRGGLGFRIRADLRSAHFAGVARAAGLAPEVS